MVNSFRSIKSDRNVVSFGETWSWVQWIRTDSVTWREKGVDREVIVESEKYYSGEYWFGKFRRKDFRQKLGKWARCSGINTKKI